MTRLTVASAQILCRPGDVAGNLATHLATITAARARGVDLLVFPELSLTDYESHPDTGALAREPDGAELRRLAEAAGPMLVVFGFIERAPEGRPYNACALVSGGRMLHVHRKVNLPTYGALVETHHYAPGATVGIVATPLGRVACLICADTWNPALPWLAALAGAEFMVAPIASARGAVAGDFDSRANWRLNLRHTAMTYGVPVVMTNHCGARGGLEFWGGSTIVDATGRVLAEAGAEPALVTAEIDPADGVAARTRLPTMRDATPALIRAELDRLLRAAS